MKQDAKRKIILIIALFVGLLLIFFNLIYLLFGVSPQYAGILLMNSLQEQGKSCGGFTPNPYNCKDGYECVYPVGMIDAPGKCVKKR